MSRSMFYMANTSLAPDQNELRRYVARGLSDAGIAKAWERDSGIRVSRSAIIMARKRYGIDSPRPRERYDDLIPWSVEQEHRRKTDLRRLRDLARRRRGEPIPPERAVSLDNWLSALKEAEAVVMYDPQTEKGFWWVKRRPEDGDVIRLPEE